MKISEINTEPKTPSTPWGLIQKLSTVMEVPLRFRNVDFDGDEAAADAIKLMKIWASDNTKGNNVHHALENIKMYVAHNGIFEQLKNSGEALDNWGYSPIGWFKEGLDANAILVQKSKGMADHVKAVTEIYDFLRFAYSTLGDSHGGETWQSNSSFVRAVFRKINII